MEHTNMTNKRARFFASTENTLEYKVLEQQIKEGTGSHYIAFSWVPEVAKIFLDLDNDQLAQTLSNLKIVSYKNITFPSQPRQISLLIYPLLNKIKTFTFEQQSMLFNTENFYKHGVWFTGRISVLLDPDNPFNQSEIGIIHMLHVLECKQKAFESRNEKKATVAVNNLRIALGSAFDEYWQKANDLKSQEQVSEQEINDLVTNFHGQCETAINAAKPELIKYRGMGNILLNILANVASLGVLMVYTHYQSGGKKVLYPLLTSDSENILKTFSRIWDIKNL